jgi:hypothetical protein
MTKDEALKLALDALDNLLYWDNGKSDYDQAREAITAIEQALAAQPAPVQEPDYWLGYGLQAHTEKPFEDATPVWTSPPAAQPAVPLTDDEIWKNDDIMAANSGYGADFETLRKVIRAIEAAHGITASPEKGGSA